MLSILNEESHQTWHTSLSQEYVSVYQACIHCIQHSQSVLRHCSYLLSILHFLSHHCVLRFDSHQWHFTETCLISFGNLPTSIPSAVSRDGLIKGWLVRAAKEHSFWSVPLVSSSQHISLYWMHATRLCLSSTSVPGNTGCIKWACSSRLFLRQDSMTLLQWVFFL